MNEELLSAWMADNVPDFSGPIAVSKFPGGQSNPTFKISTAEKNYVLRRKPPGKLLPGAHAVEREYRVMSALAATDVPVPQCYALCEDIDVIGTPFYIMQMMDGRIIWEPRFPEVHIDARADYYAAMVKTLADLHNTDYKKVGLESYGKQGNYFSRQIHIWTKQYLANEQAGRIASMDRLCEWLPDNIPDDGDETTLVHGDFRCDNLVFDPVEPTVIAVLDWELSSLGNPLADFTFHLMSYRIPPGLPAGMAGEDPSKFGLPSEAEYIEQYCRHTGRSGIENIEYYFAFNMWRLAAIVHGIKGRMLSGNASNKEAAALVSHLETLADHAWQHAVRAGAT